MSVKVRRKKYNHNLTDVSLLVSDYETEITDWDKQKIINSLTLEAKVSKEDAEKIANIVEKKLSRSGLKVINTDLIREIIDNIFLDMGYKAKLTKQKIIGMPVYDIKQMFTSKTNENSNIVHNNPENMSMMIAENTFKQFMLQEVFSKDVALAHLNGVIHIHDLGYAPRVYCGSHSPAYLAKYGLDLSQLDSCSRPAKYAHTLTGHLNTFLSVMQAYFAGALGLAYLNMFYAPYVKGMSYKELKQEGQYLVFQFSQNAFSRGGQNLFIDANIHTEIPEYYRNVKAIKDGKILDETYGDYEKEARDFAKALLDVWYEGDITGKPFSFPKCDFHISERSFTDPESRKILEFACEVSSHNGSVYFVFDRGNEAILSQCCRLREKVTDKCMLQDPSTLRFCGFANNTINLPQAAYRAKKIDNIFDEITKAMNIAVKAHLQRKDFIFSLMGSGQPLYQLGKIARDGKPYVDLEKATYIIGILGLNECVQYLTGKQLHEDDEAYKLGIKIISHMFLQCKKYSEEYKLKFSLEESPAESAAARLSKIDLREYPESSSVVKGSKENPYYTNSIHYHPAAPISLIDRIIGQSRFHPLVESGSIVHAFVGEHIPPKESILNLVEKVYRNTQCSQLVISPEFTICNNCQKTGKGMKQKCEFCGSENVYNITRIVGYYSRVNNWIPSKIEELRDRQKAQEYYTRF